MKLPSLPVLDPSRKSAIQAHLDDLTKPMGALGRMESLGLQLAWIAGDLRPADPEAFILTFGGDHGIAKHGVSAFPQEVTAQMVANMAFGGAAINVFCKANRIQHRIIDAGVASPCDFPNVSQRNVVRGTADPLAGPAMTRQQAEASLQAGLDEVAALPHSGFALLGLGEMGIANSAIAALLVSVFAGIEPEASVGPGTGVQGETFKHKLAIVKQVLAKGNRRQAPPKPEKDMWGRP